MARYSILILTHNRFDEVKRCFQSLRPTLARGDVEYAVLDNASDDGTQIWLDMAFSIIPNIMEGAAITLGARNYKAEQTPTIIHEPANVGVAAGRAKLLEQARTDRIVVLDSDTEIVDPNWLDVLDAALEPENVGVVGPGGSFVAADWSRFVAGRPGEVDCVSGYCQMFKREVIDAGAHIDMAFEKFWTEDSDFCLQVRALGWDVLCVPVGVAHHPAHSGYGEDMALHDEHIALFRSKWQGKGLVKAEGGY